MSMKIALGLGVACLLAALMILLYIPGCGWVDAYIYIRWGCEAAGGGGSGAA